MKYLHFFILVALSHLMSCSRSIDDNSNLIETQEKKVYSIYDEATIEHIVLNGAKKSAFINDKYIDSEHPVLPHQIVRTYLTFKGTPSEYSKIHSLIRPYVDELRLDEMMEKKYSHNIQLVAYGIIKNYLLPNKAKGEAVAIMKYYFDELIQLEGFDVGLLTEATLWLQSHVSQQEYNRYRDYVLTVARGNINRGVEELSEIQRNIDDYLEKGNTLAAKSIQISYARKIQDSELAIDKLSGKN